MTLLWPEATLEAPNWWIKAGHIQGDILGPFPGSGTAIGWRHRAPKGHKLPFCGHRPSWRLQTGVTVLIKVGLRLGTSRAMVWHHVFLQKLSFKGPAGSKVSQVTQIGHKPSGLQMKSKMLTAEVFHVLILKYQTSAFGCEEPNNTVRPISRDRAV